jgi:hypothetical protein
VEVVDVVDRVRVAGARAGISSASDRALLCERDQERSQPGRRPGAGRPVEELADEPFIAYPSHFRSLLHDAVEDVCAAHGFRPAVALEVSETATLVGLCSSARASATGVGSPASGR